MPTTHTIRSKGAITGRSDRFVRALVSPVSAVLRARQPMGREQNSDNKPERSRANKSMKCVTHDYRLFRGSAGWR
jgi:hypothetical protein